MYKAILVLLVSIIKSSSAAVRAASSDQLGPHGSVQVLILIKSSLVAVLAALSDWSDEAASTAADDELFQ